MPRKRGDGGVHGPDHLGAVHATKEAQGGGTMQNEPRLTDWPERRGSELGVLVKHVLGKGGANVYCVLGTASEKVGEREEAEIWTTGNLDQEQKSGPDVTCT